MNKEFSFSEYKSLLLEHFNINSHWLHFLNFIDILVFKSVSYDKLGFLVLMSQTNLSKFHKNQKILNFIRHISTKNNIEEQFWEMLEPNNYYTAIRKLEKKYDILDKFNWFNLEKLLYDLKKYKTRNSLNENKLNYCDIYQNFILGNQYSQYENNIKPFLINFINNNYADRVHKLEPYLSGLIFDIIRPRHLIYYGINNNEKLKQLIENKILQIEEGQTFFNEVYEIVKNYDKNQISEPDSELYKTLFPLIQNKDFKDKFPYIYRKLSYILGDYSDNLKLVKFCKECNYFKSSKTVCLDIIKKIILIDYKFKLDEIELNKLGFNYLLLNIKNLGKCKNSNDKILFFNNLSNFIINQKTDNVNEKNILEIDNELENKIINCNDFNLLLDLSCDYLNSKFNLNVDTEFYRLMKN